MSVKVNMRRIFQFSLVKYDKVWKTFSKHIQNLTLEYFFLEFQLWLKLTIWEEYMRPRCFYLMIYGSLLWIFLVIIFSMGTSLCACIAYIFISQYLIFREQMFACQSDFLVEIKKSSWCDKIYFSIPQSRGSVASKNHITMHAFLRRCLQY